MPIGTHIGAPGRPARPRAGGSRLSQVRASLPPTVSLLSLLSYTSGRLGWQRGLKIPAHSTSYHPKNQLIPLINNIANTHSWLHDSYHTFLHYAFIRCSFFPVFFYLYLRTGGLPWVLFVRCRTHTVGVSLPIPACRPILSSSSHGPLLVSRIVPGIGSICRSCTHAVRAPREFKMPRRLEFKLPQQPGSARPAVRSHARPGLTRISSSIS